MVLMLAGVFHRCSPDKAFGARKLAYTASRETGRKSRRHFLLVNSGEKSSLLQSRYEVPDARVTLLFPLPGKPACESAPDSFDKQ